MSAFDLSGEAEDLPKFLELHSIDNAERKKHNRMNRVVMTPVGPISYRPLAPGADHLPDGTRCFWQLGEFDCYRALLATMFAVDELAEIPSELDHEPSPVDAANGAEALHAWVRQRGWRTVYAEITPAIFNRYWIGVDVDPRGPTWNHVALCQCRALVFDPALAMPVPAGCHVQPIEKLNHAIYFEEA